ncbi:hypothetical protein IF1G_10617 [Cordyceps javanica]|uniref:Uncharacterized protein n=1 Tax=Cordyceps javanica TaxID=43265 RepID=A0A545UMH0_9HYPO|nr:hypothetical protein IF1G_10617 [Cordyceps javanica]
MKSHGHQRRPAMTTDKVDFVQYHLYPQGPYNTSYYSRSRAPQDIRQASLGYPVGSWSLASPSPGRPSDFVQSDRRIAGRARSSASTSQVVRATNHASSFLWPSQNRWMEIKLQTKVSGFINTAIFNYPSHMLSTHVKNVDASCMS